MVANSESMDTTLAKAVAEAATQDRTEKDAEATCTKKTTTRCKWYHLNHDMHVDVRHWKSRCIAFIDSAYSM